MIVIAGLGNPGPKYTHNRHNVGFMAIDMIQCHYPFSPFITKNKLSLSKGTISDQDIILCKPLGFMNVSGVTLAPLVRFYKVSIENLYVIHDDIALKPFVVRTKKGGGNAGHNGLKDIDQHIGNNYHRIRIGVGHPGHKDDVANYVLDDFSQEEKEDLSKVLKDVMETITNIILKVE